MDNTLVPGWYGKIPAMGDFTSRRLPPEFIQFWDTWLQNSIIASRAQLGENWLNLYLNCPIWRFVLMPKLYDQCIWTGILMPSVDKVGRYFPLTITVQLEASPGVLTTILNAQTWFTEIEQLALESLNASFSPEDLDQGLKEKPFPAHKIGSSNPAIQEFIHWWNSDTNITRNGEQDEKRKPFGIEDMPLFFSSLMDYEFTQSESHKTLWWNVVLNTNIVQLECFNDLPDTEQFITLLKGNDSLSTGSGTMD